MAFSLACLMNLSEAQTINHDKVEMENGKNTGMCDKLPMQPDGIVRLSKIEVHSEYLEEYVKCAIEVGGNLPAHGTGRVDHVRCC